MSPLPPPGVGVAHLQRGEQPAAALPDGFVVLGAVFFIPVSMLVDPSQDRQLTPAPKAKGDKAAVSVPSCPLLGHDVERLCASVIYGFSYALNLQHIPAGETLMPSKRAVPTHEQVIH